MPRILVVDDQAVVREPIASALQSRGFETELANNGREALDALRRIKVDLVLLDLTMPIMDGVAFLKALRADPSLRDTPVVPLTSSADRDSVLAVGRLGVRQYLVKSRFSMTELYQAVDSALNGPEKVKGAMNATPIVEESDVDLDGDQPHSESDDGGESDPVETLKSLRALMTRSQVIERIDADADLRGLSPTVAQVLVLTQNENATIEKIAGVIKQDYAIAIKVLRMANSSVYSRGQPVDTVDRAITRIGLAQIRQVVLNLAVMERFASAEICGRVTAGQFWEHALACGLIASEITHARGGSTEDADRAFTMGLVHDLGRAMFAKAFGSTYDHVLRTADDLRLPLEQVESRLLILNHADIMDRLLHAWRFPKELIDPIVFHHLSIGNIRQVAPRRVEEAATLALANRLCHALVIGESGNAAIYSTHELCTALNIGADVIQKIEESARNETTDLKLGLLANSNDTPWADQRDAVRSLLAEPLRPLFVGEHAETDGFRIFFDQIATRSDDPPNLAVVHLATAEQRERIGRQLETEEEQAGVKGLNTIVLSPTGQIGLSDRLAKSRQCELLRTPLVVPRLIESINRHLAPSSQAKAA